LIVALISAHSQRLWVVEPPWDGHRFIVRAPDQKTAEELYLRHVCGWKFISPGERSTATITELNLDENNVAPVK
jgi:hypothetical protein